MLSSAAPAAAKRGLTTWQGAAAEGSEGFRVRGLGFRGLGFQGSEGFRGLGCKGLGVGVKVSGLSQTHFTVRCTGVLTLVGLCAS